MLSKTNTGVSSDKGLPSPPKWCPQLWTSKDRGASNEGKGGCELQRGEEGVVVRSTAKKSKWGHYLDWSERFTEPPPLSPTQNIQHLKKRIIWGLDQRKNPCRVQKVYDCGVHFEFFSIDILIIAIYIILYLPVQCSFFRFPLSVCRPSRSTTWQCWVPDAGSQLWSNISGV